MSKILVHLPLENLILDAANDGSRSITLVRDPNGRYQASVQKGASGTHGVHVSNCPVEALYGALAGLTGLNFYRDLKLQDSISIRGTKPTGEMPVVAEVQPPKPIVDPDLDDLL